MTQSAIIPGFYSGNNGSKFFKKKLRSTYEQLQVDYAGYCIHCPSTVAEAREKIRQCMQKTDNNENLP